MKHIFKKFVAGFLISLLAIGMVGSSRSTLAQEEGSNPVISSFLLLNHEPITDELLDFTIIYENLGAQPAENTVIRIDYDESKIHDISLGNPINCTDDDGEIICRFGSIAPEFSGSIGVTARVLPDTPVGTEITTRAVISADNNVNPQDDFGYVVATVADAAAPGIITPSGLPVQAGSPEAEPLEEPSANQGVAIFDVKNNPNWNTDVLTTSALKFMIRGKEALAWSLNIEDSGFHNSAIRSNYLKVLTVVNSLFIIGLLVIAVMWIFSLLIPRRYLRQVVLVYGMAVIFVNFALPLNQLLIDGTGLLQKTFISDVQILDIVETPNYNDEGAVGYQNEVDVFKRSASKRLDFNLVDDEEMSNIAIGQIELNLPRMDAPSYVGTITGRGDEGVTQENVELRSTANNQILRLDTEQSIELVDEKTFNPNQEHSIFAGLMILLTGIAYFGMALVFILRIVILWALMIVSPVLFLLAIFRATRSYFFNWIGIYARWLLIGPLMALGIMIVVSIWQSVGLPVTSNYTGFGEFGVLTNIGFYLPGKDVANNLSTTSQMMEYLLFLVMLYLPIVFAFMLTRQKLLSQAVTAVAEKREAARAPQAAAAEVTAKTEEKAGAEEKAKEAELLPGGLKGFLGSKLAGLAKPAMPASMKEGGRPAAPAIETAHSFLPEHLAMSPMRDMLDLVAGEKGTRNVRKKAIEKLASPESITDNREQEKVTAVRNEISERASKGDAEAIRLQTAIQEREQQIVERGPVTEGEVVHPAAPPPEVSVEVAVSPEVEVKPEKATKAMKEEVKKEVLEELAKPEESKPSAEEEAEATEADEEESEGRKSRHEDQGEEESTDNETDDE